MWRRRRKIVRILIVLVLTAAHSRAERYGLQDTVPRDAQAGGCCDGPEGGYSWTEASAQNLVAQYVGEDGQAIRYNGNRQTADDVTGLNEPLVLFTCGVGIFLVATVIKRKVLTSIPSESVSLDLSSLESQSVNPEPVIGVRGERWGLGDREAL